MKYQELFGELKLFDDSFKFDFYKYSDHEEIKSISEEIIEEIKKQSIYEKFSKKLQYKTHQYLKTLICNFFVAYKTNVCVAIPRTKSYYSARSNFAFSLISYKVFIFCLDFLVGKNYIGQKKGYKAFGGNQKGKTSKYWALPTLYEHFITVDLSDICTPPEKEIIMKDKNKNRVNFQDTLITKSLRKKLQKINKLYQNFDFRTVLNEQRSTTRLFPRLSAIYNNCSFNDGGRLYCLPCRGLNYQKMHKQERSRITVNLADTVELDFRRLHLYMLYNICNLTPLADPYSFYPNDTIAKKTILILLNAKSTLQAKLALEKWHRDKFECELNFSPIITAAKKHHALILKYFGSGIGIKLQNLDAKIAINVVWHFAKKGIPCLPVHDSFIVAKRYKEELKAIMQHSYRMMFAADITVH